jgi:hypothetical protein
VGGLVNLSTEAQFPQRSSLIFLSTSALGDLGHIGKVRVMQRIKCSLLHVPAWRATSYLNQLVDQQYFESKTDSTLDEIYDSSSKIPKIPASAPSKLSITEPTSDSSTEKKAPSSSIDTDPAIESQILLHPADVPIITSSFNLSPTVGAELLRAIDQSRMRLKKELKESVETVK